MEALQIVRQNMIDEDDWRYIVSCCPWRPSPGLPLATQLVNLANAVLLPYIFEFPMEFPHHPSLWLVSCIL